MKEKIANTISSRSFKTFWAMLLIFALVIPYMNGMNIKVHAAGNAEVWKIYGNNTENGPVDLELISGSGSVVGKELIGKFIQGGDYTLVNEDRDKLIIADNARITAGSVNVGEIKMSGDSSLIYSDYTLSSTEVRFPSYPVTAGAITITGLQEHYEADTTPYFSDPPSRYSDPYDLTVNGNMTIAGHMEPDPKDPQNEILVPYWIGYNDICVRSGGRIIVEAGGHFIVQGSLTVDSGGTLIGSGEDHSLRICPGVTVTGLALYAETDTNEVSFDENNPSPGEYEFTYENNKWFNPFDLYSPVFNFSIGGLHFSDVQEENESISVEYKYTADGSYTDANPVVTFDDGLTVGFGISLKNIPNENTDSVFLKITFNPSAAAPSKTMLNWHIGDSETLETDDISGNIFTHEFHFDESVEVSLGFHNSGDPAIVKTIDNYLYAYAGDDDDIKQYLATELYNRFILVPMFENFGLGSASDLEARITKTGSPRTVPVNTFDRTDPGNPVPASPTIPVNNYEINWGYDGTNGNPVVSVIPVYTLPYKDDFLICTDFNKNNGTGNTFYMRRANVDEVPFDGYADDAIPLALPSINKETIVAGGMGADTVVQNSDNMYAFIINSRWLNAVDGPSQETDPANYGTKVRIVIESETYVMLTGTGETKAYGGIGNQGFGLDTIWSTRSGSDNEVTVYIGLTTLHLKPLAPETGVALRDITAVEVADPSLSAGVTIVTTPGEVQITFKSNYYASVPFKITYSDGNTTRTGELKINRVGLVIQYGYLGGDCNKDKDVPDHMVLGSDHTTETTDFYYDYFAGEQIAVWGYYYMPTKDLEAGSTDLELYMTFNDGSHRVVTARNNDTLTMMNGTTVSRGYDGRLAATNDAVATVIFLIGFAQAKTFDGVLWVGNITDTYYYDEGRKGFYATVLNAGWDDDDNFGGTQIGSGQGIYWDGHIKWY